MQQKKNKNVGKSDNCHLFWQEFQVAPYNAKTSNSNTNFLTDLNCWNNIAMQGFVSWDLSVLNERKWGNGFDALSQMSPKSTVAGSHAHLLADRPAVYPSGQRQRTVLQGVIPSADWLNSNSTNVTKITGMEDRGRMTYLNHSRPLWEQGMRRFVKELIRVCHHTLKEHSLYCRGEHHTLWCEVIFGF